MNTKQHYSVEFTRLAAPVANSSVSNCILFIRLLTHITSQCTDTNGKGWATDGEGEQILAIFTGFSLEDLLGCALTQGNLEAERY